MRVPSIVLLAAACAAAPARPTPPVEERVVLDSDGWRIAADLRLPAARPAPVVILLNKANGDRAAYAGLAAALAERGVASLRVDLRGHGESTNRGRFVPGTQDPAILEGPDRDVAAARRFVDGRREVDAARVGWVGASYSAEEVMVAARAAGRFDGAYAMLSPGSFSDPSFADVGASGARWLFVRSDDERFVKAWLDEKARAASPQAEVWVIPAGKAHATDILREHPETVGRLADWLAAALR
jgi:dienelactone hydrolase